MFLTVLDKAEPKQAYFLTYPKAALASQLVLATRKLLFASKYLLFQERCRICKKIIRPNGPSLDGNSFCPPATFYFEEKRLVCDCLCRLCFHKLITGSGHFLTYKTSFDDRSISQVKIASGYLFTGDIKMLVLKFKYDNDFLLARDLAICALSAWEALGPTVKTQTSYIVPVPLHRDRLKERGFNQSELIARHLSRFTGVKLLANAVERIRKTASQQKLGKLERESNVKNAFKADSRLVSGKKIILIDDVCTSGATILECAKTIDGAGATSVEALTVAKVEL